MVKAILALLAVLLVMGLSARSASDIDTHEE